MHHYGRQEPEQQWGDVQLGSGPSYYAQGPGLDLQRLGTVRGSLEM